jgi:hypothetical protein
MAITNFPQAAKPSVGIASTFNAKGTYLLKRLSPQSLREKTRVKGRPTANIISGLRRTIDATPIQILIPRLAERG